MKCHFRLLLDSADVKTSSRYLLNESLVFNVGTKMIDFKLLTLLRQKKIIFSFFYFSGLAKKRLETKSFKNSRRRFDNRTMKKATWTKNLLEVIFLQALTNFALHLIIAESLKIALENAKQQQHRVFDLENALCDLKIIAI